MDIKRLLPYCAVILLSGCAKTADTGKRTIEIDLSECAGTVKESLTVDSVTYIPLETTGECIIGHIKNVAVLDSLFIILDSKSDAVLAFDKNGRFCHQVGNRGEGPGEYITATQIDVSQSAGEVFIYDCLGSRVLCYDKTGKYIRSIDTVGFAFDFAYHEEDGNRGFLFVNNRQKEDKAGITRHDLNTGEIKRLVPRPTGFASNAINDFYHSNGKIFVATPPFDNDIYQASGDSLAVVFRLDVSPGPTEQDIAYGDPGPSMSGFMRTQYSITSRWLQMSFWSGMHGACALTYDIGTGEYQVSEKTETDVTGYDQRYLPICIDDVKIAVASPENPDDNPRLAFHHCKK